MLVAAGCTSDADWRDELVDLSKSEHASGLYYDRILDENTVDDAMLKQCGQIDQGLEALGSSTAALFNQIVFSVAGQLAFGVPVEVLQRDFAALDDGMAELCPDTHGRLSSYFGLDRFELLVACDALLQSAPSSEIAAACGQ